MDLAKATALIRKHEGRRYVAYKDTRGFLTIADGYNLDAHGAEVPIEGLGLVFEEVRNGKALTDAQCDSLTATKLNVAIRGARFLVSTFDTLPEIVQLVLVDMVYNLGAVGLSKFSKFLASVKAGNYAQAADEAQDSLWYEQTKGRAVEDVAMLREA